MNVSIFYRSATVWNIILFTLLMFFFLFFQEGLLNARSVFDTSFVKSSLVKFLPLNALLALTAFSVFKLKSYSKHLFVLSSLSAVAVSSHNLYGNFSKLVVISLFLFVLTAYYFYQFLIIEIEEAYYNPNYETDDLFDPMLKKISCELVDIETGKSFGGILTNWNPNGCFVYLNSRVSGAKLKNIKLKTAIGGRPFEAEGSLASKSVDKKGYGFKLKSEETADFGWRDFYSIIDQMGYNVEMLK